MSNQPASRLLVESVVTVLAGRVGEIGPLYTRLLATSASGRCAGAIFLTAEVYRDVGGRGPVFPIWESVDSGSSWTQVGSVHDQRFGFGNRYQPTLYELPHVFAGLPTGTLLLAGSAIPADMSQTHLVLYRSIDAGRSWDFCSEIDSGGPAVYDSSPMSVTSAVWEPDLYLAGDVLVCSYADERYKDRGMLQALVHKETRDLAAWSEPVVDFGVADRFTRPGMSVCSGELPDGTFRAVFEVVGPKEVPVRFACSSDGVGWGREDDLGELLISSSGATLFGSPNIAWRVASDGRTELLVTGRLSLEADGSTSNNAFFNANGGDAAWVSVPLPVQVPREVEADNSGYSQSVVWTASGSIVQATTVRNGVGSHDIVVARANYRNED